MAEFIRNGTYSRKSVAQALGLPEDVTDGGPWTTGYVEVGGDFYLFVNIGVPGRTGHDYGNRWDGKDLIWFGKTGSRLGQPQIERLLSGLHQVHVFWRADDRVPFTYAGAAFPLNAVDVIPVEITWGFADAAKTNAPVSAGARPRTRRGPPPKAGTTTTTKEDGETTFYIMSLEGPVEAVFDYGAVRIIKVGVSNDTARRTRELNSGFPFGCKLRWVVHSMKQFPSAKAAYDHESLALERLRVANCWIDGEFGRVSETQLEEIANSLS